MPSSSSSRVRHRQYINTLPRAAFLRRPTIHNHLKQAKVKPEARPTHRIQSSKQATGGFHSVPWSIVAMDKVLAFSILSASPGDIAASAGAFSTRLSWRRGAEGHEESANGQQQQQRQREREKQGGSPCPKEKPPAGSIPRFAPEFDGIDCFETIVSH
ncbi:unnamed protein product [Urochloa humidicola]